MTRSAAYPIFLRPRALHRRREQRIREDYLRILRFFRFSANLASGEFDSEGVIASIRQREGLVSLSRERIRTELLRILVARRADDAIRIMDESGLLMRVIGGVARRLRFERVCSIETALGVTPDPIFRLAALALFIEEDAARLTEKLRLSSAEANELMALAQPTPPAFGNLERPALEALLYRIGPRLYLGRLLLAWAKSPRRRTMPHGSKLRKLAMNWQRPKFPISGSDLIALGWKPGAALGEKLRYLENLWIAEGFQTPREALLARATPTPEQ